MTDMSVEVPYRPLPDGLELRPSPIHGHGTFTVVPLGAGVELGVARWSLPDRIIPERTPLGGYINHSVTPELSDGG